MRPPSGFLAVFAVLAALVLGGCNDIPNFSNTPEIKVTKAQLVKNTDSPTLADQILLEINFRDGDADIGMGDSNKVGPFAKYVNVETGQIDSSRLNPYYDNLYVSVFFRKNGVFDSLPPAYAISDFDGKRIMLSRPYSATIKPISTRTEPIEGTIKYTIEGFFYKERFGGVPVDYPYIESGQEYYLVVQMSDRERHMSNRFRTDIMIAP